MIISHYSMLGELSTRPVVKGVRESKILDCSKIDYSTLVADLKKKDLKRLIKREEVLESSTIQDLGEEGPRLVKKKK